MAEILDPKIRQNRCSAFCRAPDGAVWIVGGGEKGGGSNFGVGNGEFPNMELEIAFMAITPARVGHYSNLQHGQQSTGSSQLCWGTAPEASSLSLGPRRN